MRLFQALSKSGGRLGRHPFPSRPAWAKRITASTSLSSSAALGGAAREGVVSGARAAAKLGFGVDDVRSQGAPFPEAPVQLGRVGFNLCHRGCHPVAQCFKRGFVRSSRVETSAQAVERERFGIEEQFLLGGEVHRHRSGRDVGPFPDVVARGLAVATLGKELEGGLLDRLPGTPLSSLLSINHLCGHGTILLDKHYC